MVGKCGWYLWVRASDGLRFLCWTTPSQALSPHRRGDCVGGPLHGAGGAHSAQAACCTPPVPPAPLAPAHQACPLESRATTTQMLSVCLFPCARALLSVCKACTGSCSLWDSLCIKREIQFFGSKQFTLQNCKGPCWLRISWTQSALNPAGWVCKCLEFYRSTDCAFWP